MEDGRAAERGAAPELWRRIAFFFAGLVVAPTLLTLLYRLTPVSVGLWVPNLVMLALISVVFLVLHWRIVAMGMLVSMVLWMGFTLWLTEQVSPDW